MQPPLEEVINGVREAGRLLEQETGVAATKTAAFTRKTEFLIWTGPMLRIISLTTKCGFIIEYTISHSETHSSYKIGEVKEQ